MVLTQSSDECLRMLLMNANMIYVFLMILAVKLEEISFEQTLWINSWWSEKEAVECVSSGFGFHIQNFG